MALVSGVGLNDAEYSVVLWEIIVSEDGTKRRKLAWICPFYLVWKDMLSRSYNPGHKIRYTTYVGVSVCEQWKRFSNFKSWMETQDFEGKQLDKDLLVRGNKAYSPETCVFVSGAVNNFILEHNARRGDCVIGVHWQKRAAKFQAKCNNPFTKKNEHLGYFDSEIEAHQAWLRRKLEHAKALAALQTDDRIAKALVERYENYIHPTYLWEAYK